MANRKKVSDAILVESYTRLNNVWEVAKEVGLCGQSVWERMSKLGLINNKKKPNPKKFNDYDVLINEYIKYRDNGELSDLAKKLNRTVPFICRKAKELGLTDICHKKNKKVIHNLTHRRIESFKKNGHPKGMLGKKHNPESCLQMSFKRKLNWQLLTEEEKISKTKKQLDGKLKKYGTLNLGKRKTTWDQGWKKVGDKEYFFRSSWEVRYAKHLEEIKNNKQILNWEFEPDIFSFNGCNFYYKPDFKIIFNDNKIEYHEVKGWMCERSKIKLRLMAEQYPDIKIVIIDKKWFV